MYGPSGNMWFHLCLQYFKDIIKLAGNTPDLQALNFMAKKLRDWTRTSFSLPLPISPFFSLSLSSPRPAPPPPPPTFWCQLASKTTRNDFKEALWMCYYVANSHNIVYLWAFIPTHTLLYILPRTFMQSDINSIQIITIE